MVAAETGYQAADHETPSLTTEQALEWMAKRSSQSIDPGDVRADLAELPPGLQDSLDRLLSAVVEAAQLRDRAFASLSDEDLSFLREHGGAVGGPAEKGLVATARTVDKVPTHLADAAETTSPAQHEKARRLAAKVDRTRLAQAQAVLLEAVAAERGTLERVSETLEDTRRPSHADPSLFVAPLLAVDLGGDTHYDRDQNFWVTVDLAGDDTYNNNAGGTFIDLGGSSFVSPAALTVDVDGADQYSYTATSGTVTGGAVLSAQGGGFLGVGALVDTAGADDYRASLAVVPPSGEIPSSDFNALLQAQGGGNLGAGALVDHEGPNSYSATATTRGGSAFTTAQGAGLDGVGVLFGDTGGTTYEAESSSTPQTVIQNAVQSVSVVGRGQTVAQGAGALGAAGALVDGSGEDDYVALSSGGGAVTLAQGSGEAGVGALVDAGGRDTAVARSTVDPSLPARLDIECPSGFVCVGTLESVVFMGDAVTLAQGQGDLAGIGVMADLGDAGGSHEATARDTPSASATVTCTSSGGTCGTMNALSDAHGGNATVRAQGSGLNGGAGVLLGSAGGNTYTTDSRTGTSAAASISGGTVGLCEASAEAGDARIVAQGGSDFSVLGALVEPAGDDTYTASQGTSASATECGASGDEASGDLEWAGQGAGAPIITVPLNPPILPDNEQNPSGDPGVLLDAGGSDSYSATQGTNAADDSCWSNSPPGIGGGDAAFGIGIDVEPGTVPNGCTPVPPN